ncbi:FG-GAP-like repeat-containing protein [Colwelliaceae bacterium BS250]
MYSALTNKRLIICATIFLILIATFWSYSRYPALDIKAAMSDTLGVDGGLSFDSSYDLSAATHIIEKIGYTLLNWIHVNEQGMMFGLALSTVLLVLLPLIVNILPQGRITSIFSGLMLGIPLGLCVNCSAPIAFGLYQRQARAETALVTMLSSPLLNIVVLTMAFSLFPAYLVIIKLIFSLILIIFVVPLVVHIFQDEVPSINNADENNEHFKQQCEIASKETWLSSILWVTKELVTQGFWLLRKMLPLMLLAGLIGAVLITIIPWHILVEILPKSNILWMFVAVILLALFALILPVPITFDIILAAVLFVNDVPVIYIAVLLFTLGSFSIYSWFVLVKAGAIKTATTLAAVILIFGLMSGYLSHYYQQNFIEQENTQAFAELVNQPVQAKPVTNNIDKKQIKQQTKKLSHEQMLALKKQAFLENKETDSQGNFSAFEQLNSISQSRILPQRINASASGDEKAPVQQWLRDSQNKNIEFFALLKASETNSPFHLKYASGESLGLHYHPKPIYEQFIVPFIQTNSLASGDFNNDGWLDIVVGTYSGVYLYENIGGRFVLSPLNKLLTLDDGITGAVALQDIDNNGWLDLIWSSDKNGGYIAYNQQGKFSDIVKLPVDNRIAFAIAFDDIDHDGDLDIFWGQYFNEWMHNRKSQNLFLRQNNSTFTAETLPGPPGSALTALFSDLNNDGTRELLIGNEFEQPDMYYLSPEQKDYKSWLSYWPSVPFATMSLSSADIDNDLSLESYHAQITFNPSSGGLRVPLLRRQANFEQKCKNTDSLECQELKSNVDIVQAKRKKSAASCLVLTNEAKFECLALLLTKPNLQDSYEPVQVQQRLQLCELLKSYSIKLQQHCIHKLNIIAKKKQAEKAQLDKGSSTDITAATGETADLLTQKERVNMLYKHNNKKQATELAAKYGIDITGWAWNAKFADLDGDSWQDLFVVNGYSELQSVTANAWYRNIAGEKFIEQAEPAGLSHFNDMLSYLYIDIDNDADLDIIAFDIQGRLHTWQNENSINNHIQIEINDQIGNRNGIGAKVIIHYGDNLKQIRELKASGGFLSLDAPLAHFGLAEHQQVNSIEVVSATKQHYTFTGPFKAARRYKLTLN